MTPSTAAEFSTTTSAHIHPGAVDVAEALAFLSSSAAGLTATEAAIRLTVHGPNRIQDSAPVPAWRRLAAQFTSFLTLILIGAAVVSFAVSGEIKTPAVVIIVVLINAVIGFVQENRAEASLAALRRMLASSARVRRDGTLANISVDEIVPGDVVLVEAGDRIPADGRVILATGLEVEEAALTGESQPVAKDTSPHSPGVPLGDRRCAVFMNTTVTRGRAEILVTETGMSTEIGRIADLLRSTRSEKSPLQRQLDRLAHNLTYLAAGIVVLVAIIGLASGDSLSKVLLTAVALAVASIPEGLPAVTAVTLAIGVARMAERNAIVKNLSSVETLGCTSVICSDKTGTLTLNQMTAVELVLMNQPHEVSGDGYSPDGRIETSRGDDPIAMANALSGMALCSDAIVSRNADGKWELVGDPTEGALTVLVMKGGIQVEDLRHNKPRVAEVPFDSAHKYMATFHRMVTDEGKEVVRAWVKGAPDVLLALSSRTIDESGASVPLEDARDDLLAHNERLGARGLRVLALAQRDFGTEEWGDLHGTDPMELIDGLTLVALVGIIDPPRPEARDAIIQATWAGIDVKMITGDHAVTATTIARELGLRGETVTGSELDLMSDEDLERRITDISVFARVTPTHKMRLVARLQGKGNVVAMTGDGVNDAPALKKADIGVAMGITGTEVTKEAATMVLTDDNFATIVGAVERGRIIYDNIVKFVRFQLSTTLGFAVVFLAASLLDIANRKPFAAIAILWVNIIMDGPPAMALGVDPGSRDVMTRNPRPLAEPILTARRWGAIVLSAVVMAAGTLAVLHWAPGPEAFAGEATVAGTMGFATFVLFQFFNILNVRSESDSVFRRATLANRPLWMALAAVVALQVAVTHVGPLQGLFDTIDLTLSQWLIAVAVASSVLWAEEARKILVRHRAKNTVQKEDTI